MTPCIARPSGRGKVKDGSRELVTGHASRDHVALYHHVSVSETEVVLSLALRDQRESTREQGGRLGCHIRVATGHSADKRPFTTDCSWPIGRTRQWPLMGALVRKN